MKQSKKQIFKSISVFLCLISIGAYGQKQKKTFSETFNVSSDAVLEINTSHADIVFETWNKDQVAVEATVELENASEQEAKDYFEHDGFEIMGNSKKVTVATGNEHPWSFAHLGNMENFHIEIPEMPEFESFAFDFDFSDIENLPPMPPVPNPNFDYEAFKKDGERYLKEWQKNFEKDFGEPYQKRMLEWQKIHEGRKKEMQEHRQKMHEEQTEAQANQMAKRVEARVEEAKRRMENHQKRMAQGHAKLAMQDSTGIKFLQGDSIGNRPNIFYFNSEGKNKNFEVKKTIKIKMPKSTRIKMDVRHGEVKLAENAKNLNATLSHASLFAATIDGDKTMVTASYSPVNVEKWNYGQLRTDYSERVNLKEVLNLRLSSTSSDVTIDNLSKTAFIKNSFGPLHINSVSNDFETLDITLQNAELVCSLPKTAYRIYVNSTDSQFEGPSNLELVKTTNQGSVVRKGHYLNKNGDKSIAINAKYSEVVLD
ncbi:MAG: DUF4097 family beta strand repeat protein [Pricia sp.]|nr:DUF4097 family beta strand repeat protein [Pricia sp.]